MDAERRVKIIRNTCRSILKDYNLVRTIALQFSFLFQTPFLFLKNFCIFMKQCNR